MRETIRASRMVGVLLAGFALMVAGCGSSDSSKSTSTAASGAANGSPLSAASLKQVQDVVQRYVARPTSLGITEPVKSVPKGKTIYLVYGSSPVAVLVSKAMREAASALGWKARLQLVQQTPEAFQTGFDTALRDPATSGIISTSVPTSAIASRLQAAAHKHIPVAIINPDTSSTSDHISIGGPDTYKNGGKLEADYILAQTKGKAHVLITIPGALPTEAVLAAAFRDEWAKMCPKCETPLTYEAPLTSLGKNFPALLSAYLQAHRSIDYIVFGFNDMMIGVPPALKAAGLNGLKAVTWAQGPETNPLIGAGMLEADLALPIEEFAWVGMDAILRALNNQSTAQNSGFTGLNSPVAWFLTKDGMGEAGLDPNKLWPLDANYQQELKKVWGLTE